MMIMIAIHVVIMRYGFSLALDLLGYQKLPLLRVCDTSSLHVV